MRRRQNRGRILKRTLVERVTHLAEYKFEILVSTCIHNENKTATKILHLQILKRNDDERKFHTQIN